MYKLNNEINGKVSITRLTDGACIPEEESNTDYQAYLKWLDGYEMTFEGWIKTSEGNTPLPPDEPTEESN
jgi:hypothetical protein